MYKGPKFNREQVVFMVEVVLVSMIDRIESALPPVVDVEYVKANIEEVRKWVHGCEETAGMGLAVIYAQLTGDGMAITDALTSINLDRSVTGLLAGSVFKKGLKASDFTKFPCHKLAVNFVEQHFGDYLQDAPDFKVSVKFTRITALTDRAKAFFATKVGHNKTSEEFSVRLFWIYVNDLIDEGFNVVDGNGNPTGKRAA